MLISKKKKNHKEWKETWGFTEAGKQGSNVMINICVKMARLLYPIVWSNASLDVVNILFI